MRRIVFRSVVALGLCASLGGVVAVTTSASGAASSRAQNNHVVLIPQADKFLPFHLTIHAGDSVTWVNKDTDDHTVVSDNAFNNAGHLGLDHLIPGTDANHGKPGRFSVRFSHPGTFVYYCRFHAHLDADNQPVAPGPDGGIQDMNGNFGTPMTGVITVVGSHDHGRD